MGCERGRRCPVAPPDDAECCRSSVEPGIPRVAVLDVGHQLLEIGRLRGKLRRWLLLLALARLRLAREVIGLGVAIGPGPDPEAADEIGPPRPRDLLEARVDC